MRKNQGTNYPILLTGVAAALAAPDARDGPLQAAGAIRRRVGADVCPPGLAAAFGSTKTGQSGAVLFRR